VRPEAFHSQISIVMFPVKGKCAAFLHIRISLNYNSSILEYLNREDADNAIKTLDGKDLRGQPVRVSLAEESAATSVSAKRAIMVYLCV